MSDEIPLHELPGEPMRRRLVSARLARMHGIVRESGQIAYGRGVGISELHRQVVVMLASYGELGSTDLVVLTGQQKAQISRAVKALEEQGLVERFGRRAPLRLTKAGQETFGRVMEIARARNAALTVGLEPRDIQHLVATTRRLTRRAAEMFARERQLSADAASAVTDVARPAEPPLPNYDLAHADGKPLTDTIVPSMIALLTYIRRASSLSYKREHCLSHFEWQVLSQIGEHEPVSLSHLIALTRRNKSQVGRTVKWLEEQGLVAREVADGRKQIVLRTTEAGWRMYVSMCGLAIERDEFLLAEEGEQDRARYLAALDAITSNAEFLLAWEKGLREMQAAEG